MDGEAGWWTTSGNIGLPPLARVMGVGRQHNNNKETRFTRHRSAVEPLMIAKDRKTTLQSIHTMAVNQAVTSLGRNVVLDDRPPAINISEKELTRKERTTLAQLRSAPTRAESVRMLASTSAPTVARHHTMLSISSIVQLIQRQ